MTIYHIASPAILDTARTRLSKFQQFMAVLMKLRLGLTDQDIAYRFRVSQPTISRNFKKWIDPMYIRLKPLVVWPDRDDVRKTMPLEFRTYFGRCIAIIDCFEVFIERPSNLKARAQTWSNYKSHNTAKYLIAITPQGTVSFISKGWGGRVSDQHLTTECGLLEFLNPGDQILADRGFNIQESVGYYCAEVKLPAYTRGKKQLSQLEVDTTRQLARVRIHVERVIGLIRNKYTILQSTIPISMINTTDNACMLDKVVFICCALCNCNHSVVNS